MNCKYDFLLSFRISLNLNISSFCPALKAVAKLAHINESVAGVTLLGFGNSVIDFFITVQFINKPHEEIAIILTGFLGSSLFISICISGIIIVVAPCALIPSSCLRDLLFLIALILYLENLIEDDNIVRFYEAALVISFYVAYIAIIIIEQILMHYVEKQMKKELEKTLADYTMDKNVQRTSSATLRKSMKSMKSELGFTYTVGDKKRKSMRSTIRASRFSQASGFNIEEETEFNKPKRETNRRSSVYFQKDIGKKEETEEEENFESANEEMIVQTTSDATMKRVTEEKKMKTVRESTITFDDIDLDKSIGSSHSSERSEAKEVEQQATNMDEKKKEGTSRSRSGHDLVEKVNQPGPSSLKASSTTENFQKEDGEEGLTSSEEEEEEEEEEEQETNLTLWQQFKHSVFKLDCDEFKKSNLILKVFEIIMLPSDIFFRLIIPVVDFMESLDGWSRLLNSLQVVSLSTALVFMFGKFFFYFD